VNYSFVVNRGWMLDPKPKRQRPTHRVVILANGKFPHHPKPLRKLLEAEVLVCCDGAIENLSNFNIAPTAIVGDLDSVTEEQKLLFAGKIHLDNDQNTNDLTKAVKWCISGGYKRIDIVGATGKREDHTLGNIGLLPSYARMGAQVEMHTDTGTIVPLLRPRKLKSYRGQQVSIFSPNNSTNIKTYNLKYPIDNRCIDELWMGTLNESLGDWFRIDFHPGPLIVYRKYDD